MALAKVSRVLVWLPFEHIAGLNLKALKGSRASQLQQTRSKPAASPSRHACETQNSRIFRSDPMTNNNNNNRNRKRIEMHTHFRFVSAGVRMQIASVGIQVSRLLSLPCARASLSRLVNLAAARRVSSRESGQRRTTMHESPAIALDWPLLRIHRTPADTTKDSMNEL